MQRSRQASDTFGYLPDAAPETVDCCPVCLHARDEQGPAGLPDTLARWRRKLRRQATAPAACLATVDVELGRWGGTGPCSCREPFHGS